MNTLDGITMTIVDGMAVREPKKAKKRITMTGWEFPGQFPGTMCLSVLSYKSETIHDSLIVDRRGNH